MEDRSSGTTWWLSGWAVINDHQSRRKMNRQAILERLLQEEASCINGRCAKTLAMTYIGAVLDEIDAEVREPGAWEAHNLAAAVGFLAASLYGASIACLKRTLTVTKQGPTWAPKVDGHRMVPNLRQALAAADRAAVNEPLSPARLST